MHECQKNIIVNFIIRKLKSKHTSLKKYTNWAKLIYFSLVLREREEKKTKYFAPSPNGGFSDKWKHIFYSSSTFQLILIQKASKKLQKYNTKNLDLILTFPMVWTANCRVLSLWIVLNYKVTGTKKTSSNTSFWKSKGSDHLAHSWGGLGRFLGSQWDRLLKYTLVFQHFSFGPPPWKLWKKELSK